MWEGFVWVVQSCTSVCVCCVCIKCVYVRALSFHLYALRCVNARERGKLESCICSEILKKKSLKATLTEHTTDEKTELKRMHHTFRTLACWTTYLPKMHLCLYCRLLQCLQFTALLSDTVSHLHFNKTSIMRRSCSRSEAKRWLIPQ